MYTICHFWNMPQSTVHLLNNNGKILLSGVVLHVVLHFIAKKPYLEYLVLSKLLIILILILSHFDYIRFMHLLGRDYLTCLM